MAIGIVFILLYFVGTLCWLWGFCCGQNNTTDWIGWNTGWKDGWEAGWDSCERMQREDKPSCFGKPSTPNGDAENGCDGCEFVHVCHALRQEGNDQ